MPRVTLPRDKEADPLVYVPSLNSRVTGLRFYDRAFDHALPWDTRVYKTTFSHLTTRVVGWEVHLVYPPQAERVEYEIEAVYYRSDGTVFARQSLDSYVDAGWTNSRPSWGWGYRLPLQWEPGSYKVELFLEGQLIASEEFEVVDSRVPRKGLFLDLREGLPWNSWQPSVDDEKALLALAGLMEIDPALATQVASLPWVQESLTDEGRNTLEALDILAREDVDLARRVAGTPWLADDVTEDEWLAVRTLTLLAVQDAAVGKFIADFDWLNDGITEDERWALDALQDITIEHPSLAKTLLSLPWLGGQLTKQEGLTVRDFKELVRRDSHIAQQVADMRLLDGPVHWTLRTVIWTLWKLYDLDPGSLSSLSSHPWFDDGLDDEEAKLVDDLGYIALKSEADALSIISMPFLKTFEPADALAIKGLNRLVTLGNEEGDESVSEHFRRVMGHPAISDGITDDEAKIVSTLGGVSEHNPDLVDTLLDPAQVTLEERSIDLPLSGKVDITIIRTRQGSERTMDLLENAVRDVEEFMEAPIPKRHVIYLFEDAVTPGSTGTHFGSNITSRPKVDDANEYSAERAFRHFTHEVAHYYWRSSDNDWIDEGPANFISSIAANAEYGQPVAPTRTPCALASNIAELEGLEPEQGSPEFSCNYSLGERIFHDLHRNMDDTSLRLAFRRLYLLSQVDDPGDGCEGTDLNICHVKAAFTADIPKDTGATVEKVLARWYHGSEPYDLTHLDTGAVDPNLPSIQGRITDVFISLDQDWPVDVDSRTSQISIADIQKLKGRVYVYRQFSFPYTTKQIVIPLETVEYYMDGFIYARDLFDFYFEVGKSYSWWRAAVGPSNAAKWRPGRYGVYMYDGERKVAQVEYEVTP